jgi:hypothetical protein
MWVDGAGGTKPHTPAAAKPGPDYGPGGTCPLVLDHFLGGQVRLRTPDVEQDMLVAIDDIPELIERLGAKLPSPLQCWAERVAKLSESREAARAEAEKWKGVADHHLKFKTHVYEELMATQREAKLLRDTIINLDADRARAVDIGEKLRAETAAARQDSLVRELRDLRLRRKHLFEIAGLKGRSA